MAETKSLTFRKWKWLCDFSSIEVYDIIKTKGIIEDSNEKYKIFKENIYKIENIEFSQKDKPFIYFNLFDDKYIISADINKSHSFVFKKKKRR